MSDNIAVSVKREQQVAHMSLSLRLLEGPLEECY